MNGLGLQNGERRRHRLPRALAAGGAADAQPAAAAERAARTGNPAWPDDPDVKRRKEATAKPKKVTSASLRRRRGCAGRCSPSELEPAAATGSDDGNGGPAGATAEDQRSADARQPSSATQEAVQLASFEFGTGQGRKSAPSPASRRAPSLTAAAARLPDAVARASPMASAPTSVTDDKHRYQRAMRRRDRSASRDAICARCGLDARST